MKTISINLCICFVVLFSTSLNVCAHEKRDVKGSYQMIVGFATEPAFSGQMNGVDLHVLQDGVPVEGLEQNLKVTVIREQEKQTMDLSFQKKYKEPGRYNAYFLPTQPGQYVFLIEGVINGMDINERFVSGEQFSNVHDSKDVEFP